MKTYVVIICEQVAYAIDVQSHDNEGNYSAITHL